MAEIKLKTNSNPHIDLSDSQSNPSLNVSSDSNSPHIAMNDMSSAPAVAMSNIVPTKLLGVKDVLVDGESVVSDNIANIDLAPVSFTGDYDDLIDKPTNVSTFINDAGYLTSYVETDPTVPSWAKEESKPSYTASEISGLIDMFYPVGSYYETSDEDFDPNVAWGGYWELEIEGQVHIGAGENYEIHGAGLNFSDGGSKDAVVVSHTHTGPSHAHGIASNVDYFLTINYGTTGSGAGETEVATSSSSNKYALTNTSSKVDFKAVQNTASAGTGNTGSTGENGTNKNLQPYIVVNRWHRVA